MCYEVMLGENSGQTCSNISGTNEASVDAGGNYGDFGSGLDGMGGGGNTDGDPGGPGGHGGGPDGEQGETPGD